VSVKENRLGKGLEALIPRNFALSSSTKAINDIPLDEIQPNPFQPRMLFDDAELESLAESIRNHGVAQPVLVRRRGNHYELIAGERRLRASKLAGRDTIPAIIRNFSDQESIQIALIENLQRQDLNAIEVAQCYQRLIQEFEMTHQDVAKFVGKSRAAISNTLRLLSLPQTILDAVRTNQLSEGHARALLTISDPLHQSYLFSQIISNPVSVRELEALVMDRSPLPNTETTSLPTRHRNMLHSRTGLKVTIQGVAKGAIRVTFRTQQEKEKILSLLQDL
jgi:ParB family chromosome partitioning protein